MVSCRFDPAPRKDSHGSVTGTLVTPGRVRGRVPLLGGVGFHPTESPSELLVVIHVHATCFTGVSWSDGFEPWAWQAFTWTFLLGWSLWKATFCNYTASLIWRRYASQEEWRRCIDNELFKAFHNEGRSRKRLRSGDEIMPMSQHKFVRREKKSDFLACQQQDKEASINWRM